MALSTTQSIWRSGGGDQSRTAYCGSGVMAAQFYLGNIAVGGTAVVSSATGAPSLVLPAGAVVTEIQIFSVTGSGTVDVGFTPAGGSNTAAGLANDAVAAKGVVNLSTATAGANLGSTMSTTALTTITYAIGGTPGTGAVSGQVIYYVLDPLVGQQNV